MLGTVLGRTATLTESSQFLTIWIFAHRIYQIHHVVLTVLTAELRSFTRNSVAGVGIAASCFARRLPNIGHILFLMLGAKASGRMRFASCLPEIASRVATLIWTRAPFDRPLHYWGRSGCAFNV